MSGVAYEELRDSDLRVSYSGVDIGQAIVKDCRRKHPQAQWHQMNVMDLAFPDELSDRDHCRRKHEP